LCGDGDDDDDDDVVVIVVVEEVEVVHSFYNRHASRFRILVGRIARIRT